MAPLLLARRLKIAHDAVGPHQSLEGLVVGVRLTRPGLKPVNHPYGGQFVIYSMPDDQARAFECDGENGSSDGKSDKPKYGNFFGATFYVKVPGAPTPVAVLWAQDEGYWRIVAWQTDADDRNETPDAATPPVAAPAKIAADAGLITAATDFLESWLVRKDYAKAFGYLSADAFACYDVVRGADQPAAASADDAGRRIRAALEQAGNQGGPVRALEDVVSGVPPVHPATRVMDHRRSRAFTLTGIPNALADAASCQARARGVKFTGEVRPEYGRGFVTAVRFRASGNEAAVLRLLWMKQDGTWRITAYDVDLP